MATSSIADQIRDALGAYLKQDPSTIFPQHTLRDDLGLDSMAMIELLFRIEEKFDLQIPDDDLQGLVTVSDVIGYVERKLNPAPAARPKQPAKRLAARKKG
jgi:acyl carrier protein